MGDWQDMVIFGALMNGLEAMVGGILGLVGKLFG